MTERFNLKNLEPKILKLPELKLAVKCITMTFSHDKTIDLWKSFGPLVSTISNRVDDNKYSIQIYPDETFFQEWDPNRQFQKYAGLKVNDFEALPGTLERLIIPSGQYAVFDYIGKPSEASESFRYILEKWLTASRYMLDNRPHIAIMGNKYKGEHPDSEEELLFPIKLKDQ